MNWWNCNNGIVWRLMKGQECVSYPLVYLKKFFQLITLSILRWPIQWRNKKAGLPFFITFNFNVFCFFSHLPPVSNSLIFVFIFPLPLLLLFFPLYLFIFSFLATCSSISSSSAAFPSLHCLPLPPYSTYYLLHCYSPFTSFPLPSSSSPIPNSVSALFFVAVIVSLFILLIFRLLFLCFLLLPL